MRNALTLLALALALTVALMLVRAPAVAADNTRLVLVAAAHSTVAPMSAAQVRRLYLGIPVIQDGREITPLGNNASAAASEIFLQHVLFMSSLAYERQMTTRVYRAGGNRIRIVDDVRALVDALAADPWAVSYMTAEAAAQASGIRVVNEL